MSSQKDESLFSFFCAVVFCESQKHLSKMPQRNEHMLHKVNRYLP